MLQTIHPGPHQQRMPKRPSIHTFLETIRDNCRRTTSGTASPRDSSQFERHNIRKRTKKAFTKRRKGRQTAHPREQCTRGREQSRTSGTSKLIHPGGWIDGSYRHHHRVAFLLISKQHQIGTKSRMGNKLRHRERSQKGRRDFIYLILRIRHLT